MDESKEIIGGTVIQRSFVGRGLVEVLNIASVPVAEITQNTPEGDDENFLRRLTAEILGVPGSTILDDHQYNKFRDTFLNAPPRVFRRFPHPFWDDMYFEWRERTRGSLRPGRGEHPIPEFFEDMVSLIGGRGSSPSWLLGWPLDRDSIAELFEDQVLGGPIDDDALSSAMACVHAGLTASPKVKQFASSMLHYDIPMGQSPSTSSDSLQKLLETGKKMCLAPLAAGGAIGIGQLGTGSYAAAVLTVGTGSVMTLILIGTVAVGTILINRVAQQRLNSPPPDNQPRRRRRGS